MNVEYIKHDKAAELHSKGGLIAEVSNVPDLYTDQTFLDVCKNLEKYNPLNPLYVERILHIYLDGSVKGLRANLYQEVR
jgi:hypothetical protein